VHENGLLIGYLEMSDLQQGARSQTRAGGARMRAFFTALPGRPDEGLMRFEKVFQLD